MRAIVLIAGGLLIVAVVAVLLLGVLRGGGSKSAGSAAPAAASQGVAGNPASIRVAVLNGTSTVGLAHHLATSLQQSGYAQAKFLTARPSGSHPTTIVLYSSDHRADARAVARALGVSAGDVDPLDPGTRALSSSATVVVVAGEDRAGAVSSTGAGAAAGTGGGGAGAGVTGQ
jgi:LytR cell envelope-related transcriptional attenuator